jgi:hypothetical protein
MGLALTGSEVSTPGFPIPQPLDRRQAHSNDEAASTLYYAAVLAIDNSGTVLGGK